RGPQRSTIDAGMAGTGRRAGNDAGVGRTHGSVFFSASRARSAIWVQGCGCRSGTRAADDLSTDDRTKRNRHGSALQCSFGEQMTDTQLTRASTAAELTIATPEGVLFRLPLAGPASRLYAMLLDTAIVLGTVNGVGLLVYWIFSKAPGFGFMVITLAEFAIGFAYSALLEGLWNGQTIGKRLLHLRVIDQDGLPLRIEQAWVRNLMRVFDALPFAYLVGGLSVLSSPLMQRFGDRVAGTLVVRQTPLAAPGEEPWMRQKYNSFMDYPALARKLRSAATPELAILIQDVLRRRSELAAYARREIYRELAAYLQSEISRFPDELIERLSDEQYLINASGILFGDQLRSRAQSYRCPT